ncbi:MAG: response regulator [Verrucomicrobia bacterium]|nr:response regulator [Verrucomicrobiota bacterium]
MSEKVILLVEDNPSDIGLARRALEKKRIANQLVVAEDGQEALDYLFGTGQHAGRDVRQCPAVVLLDLKLPRVDGLTVLQRIRADARTQLVPVVVLTTSKEDEDLIKGYRLGCNSYIRKPIDFNQFAEAVGQLGLYWLVLNEAPPVKL